LRSEYQQEPGGYVDAGGHRVIPVDPAEVERVVQEFRSKVGTQPAVGAEFHKVSEERFMSVDAKRNGNGNVTSDVDEFYASRQGYPGSGAGAEVPPPVPSTRSASVRTRDLPPLPPQADDYMGMRASAFSQSYGPGTTFVSVRRCPQPWPRPAARVWLGRARVRRPHLQLSLLIA